jgi:predicted metal-dependent hydrolase
VRQFNEGQYFECHETLEALWKVERRPLRKMYQGVLQIGVALYHLERSNRRGALILLERGLNHLRGFTPLCQGIDTDHLASEAQSLAWRIADQGDTGNCDDVPKALFPKVRLVGVETASEVGKSPC